MTILITPEQRQQLQELSTLGVVPVPLSAVAAYAFSLGLLELLREKLGAGSVRAPGLAKKIADQDTEKTQ